VKGEANHIASRLSDSFVPASEASCGSLYWGHNCRSWRWRVAARDMCLRCVNCRNAACSSSVQVWTDEINGRHYRVLDALFVAVGNRGWRRRSSRCLASVRGTASSGDNLAPRRADLSTTRADVLLRGWSGQDFPQACANLPTAYRMRSRRHARVLFKSKHLVNGGHGVDGAKRSHRAEISS
jgi:hypothetical protein